VTRHGTYTPARTKNYQQLVNVFYKGKHFGDKALKVKIRLFYKTSKTTKLRKSEIAKKLKEIGWKIKGVIIRL